MKKDSYTPKEDLMDELKESELNELESKIVHILVKMKDLVYELQRLDNETGYRIREQFEEAVERVEKQVKNRIYIEIKTPTVIKMLKSKMIRF